VHEKHRLVVTPKPEDFTMNAITPFVFEDQLVRSVIQGDEHWFVGKDVCHVLGIKDHHQALEKLDDDERGGYIVPTPHGEQNMIIICEAGVFRLIFTSRKAEAERFKRWLAHDVLPTLRKTGSFTLNNAAKLQDAFGNDIDISTEALPVLQTKLAMVREARHLWGHERARAIWKQMGLAVPPDDFSKGSGEARDCLQYLLDGELHGHSLLHLLGLAMDGDEGTHAILKAGGIYADPENDGFIIANRHPHLEHIMQGTKWAKAKWQTALRRLPNALPSKPRTYSVGINTRGIFVPASNLDFENAAP
jgi:prophage antirepressor-like protein